ncbi:MAG: sigma 54-interacting transcriptional regulator [Deltaproteobacteria bacterium]|nr:MAG: sigma 54-interacting transcriptional regulator [Deltaproteobacteria bacterium]
MTPICSILWVGRGDGSACSIVADAPQLDVAWVRDAADALSLPMHGFDAVLLDAADADDALAELRRLTRRPRTPPLLVRVGSESAQREAELRTAGAGEILLRAPDADPSEQCASIVACVTALVRDARERLRPTPTRTSARRRAAPGFEGIIGESAALQALFGLLQRAAGSRATILLTGETGTGKELFARAIHLHGPRRSRSFVPVNCAAFPDTLLESELFGHVRGAFTGADRDKKGLFDAADGGTLFLDEIGETSPALQAKLLRTLQEGEVRPIGGTRVRRLDVRVVAATNRDLRGEVERGRFREDLYYRLSVFPIVVPPLRKRPEDILPLARHFLSLHGRRERKAGCTLSSEARDLLLAYAWPGNVRELENEIQRAVALAEPHQTITPDLLSPRLIGFLEPVQAAARPGDTLRERLGRIEAWLIRRQLDAHGGRRAETARRLGITREGLYKKMKRYGIR